jgi:hypothetical protein
VPDVQTENNKLEGNKSLVSLVQTTFWIFLLSEEEKNGMSSLQDGVPRV